MNCRKYIDIAKHIDVIFGNKEEVEKYYNTNANSNKYFNYSNIKYCLSNVNIF